MWSLAFELNKTAGEDLSLPIMKKLSAMQSVSSIVKIILQECKKHNKIVDDIESIKIAVWNELATLYKEEEIVANVPTMIETLFYNEYEWLSKIKNLESNITRMAFLAIEDDVKPKVTRIVTDQYNDILSKHVYRYLKNKVAREME